MVDIKQALVNLLQHGIVNVEIPEGKLTPRYTINSSEITDILSWPKFSNLMRELFDLEGEAIAEHFMLHGFDSEEQAIRDCTQTILDSLTQLGEVTNFAKVQRSVAAAFEYMAAGHWLVVARRPTLDSTSLGDEHPAKRVRITPAKPEPSKPKAGRAEASPRRNSAGPAKAKGRKPKTPPPPPARPPPVVNFDDIPALSDVEYRININRLHLATCLTQATDLLSGKLDGQGCQLMESVFNEVQKRNPQLNEKKIPVDPAQLAGVLDSWTEEEIRPILESLSKDTKFIRASGDAFDLNLRALTKVLQQKVIESIVAEKFDPETLRIFRLLMLDNFLEQKQIADLSMIPIKQSRALLYEMHARNYIQLQEIPKTADRHPTRTFFLWSVDMKRLAELLQREVCKTHLNMALRLEHQLELNDDLIAKAHDEDLAMERGLLQRGQSLLSEAERAHIEWLQRAGLRLGGAQCSLAHTLLLLSRFNIPLEVQRPPTPEEF